MVLPKYEPPSTGANSSSKSSNGLTVSVRPLVDGNESRKYFGTDLTSKNILAIFISLENKSNKRIYIIPKKSITFKYHDSATKAKNATNSPGDSDAGEALATAGVIVSPLLMGAGLTIAGDQTVINHAFKSNEYQNRTLSPGNSAQGFLYFKWPNEFINHKSGILNLTARDPIANESIKFHLPIQLKGRKAP